MRKLLMSLSILCVLALAGCDYDFPITANPTRRVDRRLLGTWTPLDEAHRDETLSVVQIDGFHYAALFRGELYLVHHSDVAGLPLLSVRTSGKYAYFAARVSDDGKRLTLMDINKSVIPPGAPDARDVVKLIELNRCNPYLFNDPLEYARD